MTCLVCALKIEPGERILSGCVSVYRGPTDSDLEWDMPTDHLDGSLHLDCLKSLSEAARTSNTMTHDLAEEEVVVERSDALSLLGL